MGIGFLELVVIAVVALVLLGPQKLPEVLQQLGRIYVQFRRTSMEFKSSFDDVVRKAEEEVRMEEIRRLTNLAKQNVSQLQASTMDALTKDITDPMPTSGDPQQPTPSQAHDQTTHPLAPPMGRSDFASQVFDNPKPLPPQTVTAPIDQTPMAHEDKEGLKS